MDALEALLLTRAHYNRTGSLTTTETDPAHTAIAALTHSQEAGQLTPADDAFISALIEATGTRGPGRPGIGIDEALPSLATLFWSHGSLQVPVNATFGDWKVGTWLANRRREDRAGTLNDRMSEVLHSMGLTGPRTGGFEIGTHGVRIPQSTTTLIVGRSGSGKTRLAQRLAQHQLCEILVITSRPDEWEAGPQATVLRQGENFWGHIADRSPRVVVFDDVSDSDDDELRLVKSARTRGVHIIRTAPSTMVLDHGHSDSFETRIILGRGVPSREEHALGAPVWTQDVLTETSVRYPGLALTKSGPIFFEAKA